MTLEQELRDEIKALRSLTETIKAKIYYSNIPELTKKAHAQYTPSEIAQELSSRYNSIGLSYKDIENFVLRDRLRQNDRGEWLLHPFNSDYQ